MTSTTVSVVMPVYNAANYLDDAVRSVLTQSFEALELIVVDDGSTDRTSEIARKWAARDSRVSVVTQPNSGKPSIARNAGIRRASGELICFLDGDDVYLPGRVEKAVDLFRRHPDVDIVFHDLKRMTTEGELREGTYLHGFKFPSRAMDHLTKTTESTYLGGDRFYCYVSAVFCPLLTPATMIRASRLHREVPVFREDLRCGEDVDLWLRLAFDSRMAYIDEPLCAYRYHESSTTQDKEDFYLGTIEAHRANLERGRERLDAAQRRRYTRRIAERYQHLAYWYHQRQDPRRARKSYCEAFRLARDYRIIPRYLKTFLPKILVARRRGATPRVTS